MLPWTYPSPQPKRHLDPFSHFCRARGKESLCFTTGRHSPLKIARCYDGSERHLIHGSLGPRESSTQTTSRSFQPFWATVCKTVRPILSDRCLSVLSVLSCHVLSVCLSVCNVGVLWPNGWMNQDETRHAGIGFGSGHIVLHGDPAPPIQKGGAAPQFSARVRCGQMAGWIKFPLGMEVGLGPGDFVLDGDHVLPQKGHSPQFSAHAYCGQTAGWMMMPLGTEVDLGPGQIVLDGDPAPPREKGTAAPLFSAHIYCGHGRPPQLLLSSCYTAHGRVSLYFTLARPLPSRLPLPMGDLD